VRVGPSVARAVHSPGQWGGGRRSARQPLSNRLLGSVLPERLQQATEAAEAQRGRPPGEVGRCPYAAAGDRDPRHEDWAPSGDAEGATRGRGLKPGSGQGALSETEVVSGRAAQAPSGHAAP
jgi:hypothetical protein